MKKTILLAAVFGLLASGTVYAIDDPAGSNGVAPGSGITGSKHDLSVSSGIGLDYPSMTTAGGADPLDRICIWCHAPHHSMVTNDSAGIDYLPLWNHQVTSAIYTTYMSDFGDGPDASGMPGVGTTGNVNQFADRHLFNGADTIGQPGGVSRLCLSCHDGTIAVNEYGRAAQRDYSESKGGVKIKPQFTIGGNQYGLLNHHPIGFSYIAVTALDDEIAPITDQVSGVGVGMTTIGSLLYNGKMECVTCHDVHNSKNSGETFLWKSDRNSEFCLTCHKK